jgi:glucose/arabinose dehydrogenase
VLSVTPGSLAFTGQAGDANLASQTLSVTNAGGGTLPWAASGNATWLSATPSSGAAPSTVSVSVDISGLAAGTYDGTVTITSTGATGSPKNVPVTLSVTSPPAAWPQISLSPVAGGFVQPVHVTHAGDGSGRIFVVEQAGRIRILDNGVVLPVPFLDLASLNPPRLVAGGEQGLLGVVFPPGFDVKQHFYVFYTRAADGAIVVARYRVTAGDGNVADPASEVVILVVPHPVFGNHNGGQLAFGPDGYLYIGTGDGGSGGDPSNNAQNPGVLLGKQLRVDVESGVNPYGVPPDNPFVGTAGFRPEIWALGLRNPWRFSFDRLTGDHYIGDVGQGNFEEIDFQPAGDPGGRNYGWNIMEGDNCYPPGTAGCNRTGLALPIFVYDHALGCSVTGGHVYRGSAFPSLQGVYLFGDYCSGRIWGIRKNSAGWDNALLATSTLSISTFGEDESGNVYVVNHANGDLLKILSP